MVDLKDLEKLSPKERIKVLEEIKKKNKEEIEKAQSLIIESEEEIEKAEEIEQIIKEVPLPKQKQVDVSDLWKSELEEKLKKEKISITEEQRQYGRIIAETKPIEEITQKIYNIKDEVKDKGYINRGEQESLQANIYALRKKEEKYEKAGLEYEAKKASHAQEEAERFLNLYRMAG